MLISILLYDNVQFPGLMRVDGSDMMTLWSLKLMKRLSGQLSFSCFSQVPVKYVFFKNAKFSFIILFLQYQIIYLTWNCLKKN